MNILAIKEQVRRAYWSLLVLVLTASGPAMAGGIGGTGITAFGVVQRFGSIYVNGREYALDARTSVTIDGIDANTNDLRLGEAVGVNGAIDASGHAHALRVQARHAVIGPIEAIKRGELSVMGQRVSFDAQTRFVDAQDRPSALSRLKTGEVVAVSALPGPNGIYLATRIALAPPTHAEAFLLRGTLRAISDHRIEVAGRRLRVAKLPAGALEGRRVVVAGRLESGAPRVERVEVEAPVAVKDGDRVEFSGFVAAGGAREWIARGIGLHFAVAGAASIPDRPVALIGVQRPDGRVQVERVIIDIQPMRIDLPAWSRPNAPTEGRVAPSRSTEDRPDRDYRRPDTDGLGGQSREMGPPEIARPEIERPHIERPEIERPEVMGE